MALSTMARTRLRDMGPCHLRHWRRFPGRHLPEWSGGGWHLLGRYNRLDLGTRRHSQKQFRSRSTQGAQQERRRTAQEGRCKQGSAALQAGGRSGKRAQHYKGPEEHSTLMAEDKTGWRCPVPDDPVDSDILKDHATIIKRCHACHNECLRYSATGNVTISGTKFHGTTPGARESVVGFFVCQTCPPHPKSWRHGRPMPYRRLWCNKCLKFLIPGAFSLAFNHKPDGSWTQNPISCWHCSTSGINPEMRDCLNSCPKTLYNDIKAQKPKRKPVTAPSTRPSKQPRTSEPPILAPSLSVVDPAARLQENYQQLAATVKERGLFTSKALPEDFLFFLPDFVFKGNDFELVEPSLQKKRFPKTVVLGCAKTTNGNGVLMCTSCSEPLCVHVSVLERLVDVTKLKAPVSERRLPPKEEPPAEEPPEQKPKAKKQQLSKLGFKATEDYWAVQLDKEKRWVLCGKTEDGTWACQKCKGEGACKHACEVTGLPYLPPVVTKRYSRDPSLEWADIPPETPPPVKPKSRETTVCDACRPAHADGIPTHQFHGCSHQGRRVHVCTEACAIFPCSPIPKAQLSDEGGPVNRLMQREMQEAAAKGIFSESSPTSNVAPCGARWLRENPKTAPFYTEADTSKVALCVWRCNASCCVLRPHIDEIYFQPPSELRVSHKVLAQETNLLYKGKTFKLLAERAEEEGLLRPGREPPLARDALTRWFQGYLRTILATAPRPELPPQPGPNQWTPALRELLRESPVLLLEPADPQTLVGRTFWKLFSADQQWWRGRVTGYSLTSDKGELFPHYKVEYPGDEQREDMTWRDLCNRLNPLEEGDDQDWGPHPREWSPPGWRDGASRVETTAPSAANQDVLADHHQKPWPTCPICKEFPEALYIDCREAHMKHIYKDPHTGAYVNVLPIIYPFANRVAALDINPYRADCCCHRPKQTSDNSSIMGAPKVVAGAQLRKLLKQWSGHIPVSMKYERGKKEAVPIPVPDAQPKPLSVAEREKLSNLAPCVYKLVDYIDRNHASLCPNPAYRALFYHLGFLHSDAELLRHGAQDTVVQILMTLKLSSGAPHIEIECEWDQALHTYAPCLQAVLLSGKDGDQRRKGFRKSGDTWKSGEVWKGTGYKVKAQLLYALAPLLQHLLRLSFWETDYTANHQASALLCEALGVERGEICWGCLPGDRGLQRVGKDVYFDRVEELVDEIRELMSGPCRGTSDGILAGEAYVANQHRLSSSNVYHRVFRDVPQYAGKDRANGKCVGGERVVKCNEETGETTSNGCPELVSDEVPVKGVRRQKGDRSDTDGVMLVTCKHCFVYYYHVLLRHESLRDVFTFLVTRFQHRPPNFIIYDNACEFARYCRARWPEFFAHTMFLTDNFHGVTHKCSDEFKYHVHLLDKGREFQGLPNTSVPEQINSLMKRFDSTQAASTITNAMLVYDYFIYRHNMKLHAEWLAKRWAQGSIAV
ncbi:hypothetical protein KFL_010410030 [Klebsormidium nitens]|uniref:Uncharacterized protein n=1 Tax=Klebsormidium nitens TaxID=105231 RepID=A0A1Y1INT2_KLENI|nr:hypothetical protein KFL_010410030 [Klebsormidium nitens]|eukprot:GAQ92530.1 hypothetical protein KFL_010410030 [Klebsormidium nitens]